MIETGLSLSPQILPVPSQVRPVCADPQGDPHRLPLHQPGQGQEEQADGHGRLLPGPQPQQLLHQLRQLRGLLRGRAAEPDRTGKMAAAAAASLFSGSRVTVVLQFDEYKAAASSETSTCGQEEESNRRLLIGVNLLI